MTIKVKEAVPMKGELSITEAAELLDVSRVAVWRWVKSGKIPARRTGLGDRAAYAIKAQDIQEAAQQLGIDLTLNEIYQQSERFN